MADEPPSSNTSSSWQCQACTLINQNTSTRCDACLSKRSHNNLERNQLPSLRTVRSSRKQKLARNTENNVPSDHSSGDGGLLNFFAPSNGQKAEPPDEKIAQYNEGCIDLISDDNGNDGADRTTDQQRRVTLPDEQQKQSLKNRRKKWRDTGSSTTMKTNERKSKKRKIILESDEEDDDNDYFPPTRRASNNHRVAASKSSSIADYINTRTNNQGKVSHYNHEMISSKYQNKR